MSEPPKARGKVGAAPLHIVRGDPTAEEIAALVLAISARRRYSEASYRQRVDRRIIAAAFSPAGAWTGPSRYWPAAHCGH